MSHSPKLVLEESISTTTKDANNSKVKSDLSQPTHIPLERPSFICNHCLFECHNSSDIREHYRSDFHRYNLNRVAMNFAPLPFEEYKKRKEAFLKKEEEKKKLIEKEENKIGKDEGKKLYCDVCDKKFSSHNKLNEHLRSKNHIKRSKLYEEKKESEIKTTTIKTKEPEKTTKDDETICLFCNFKSSNLEDNFIHMVKVHDLKVPFIFYIKNHSDLLKILIKKIIDYHACLTCDTQRFPVLKQLQAHMLDKSHTKINHKDLDEFLYKYYDYKKLLRIKEPELRRSKEFKIIHLRLKVAKELKEKDLDGNEWESVEENEEELKLDYEPIVLPSGELMTDTGKVLGNKEYNIYYKQRPKINKFEEQQKERRIMLKRKGYNKAAINEKINNIKKFKRKAMKRNKNNHFINGSHSSNFTMINKVVVKRQQIQLV